MQISGRGSPNKVRQLEKKWWINKLIHVSIHVLCCSLPVQAQSTTVKAPDISHPDISEVPVESLSTNEKATLNLLRRAALIDHWKVLLLIMKMIIIEYWNLSISQSLHLQMSIMKITRDYSADVTVNIKVLYVLV